ncbi:MAG: cysteine desulfurase NifS [Clostridia bacterium]|nr:cysteine desulfurase NifS [Clostridia bacterium]
MSIKYFDNAGTTKISKEVFDEMLPFMKEKFGNPSSIYGLGREAKKAVERARKRVAGLINCSPEEIYFTGSGSESDNTAIKGIMYAKNNRKKHIITSKIEHPAVLNTCKYLEKHGFLVTYLNVDENGFVNLNELKNSIRDSTGLISIMFANNEIGTIEPIGEIAKIAKTYNIVFHTDSVQACGNVPIDVRKMGIDMLSLSGHKIHAPKGIGALYVKKGIDFEKLIEGGAQEKGKRSGTENVAGIVALGKACEIAKNNLNNHINYLKGIRDYYIDRIINEIPNSRLNGSIKNRLPGNANFSFEGIEGEALLLNLDAKGICASSGSACSSNSQNPSHVLTAIGLTPKQAYSTLRTTFDEENSIDDVDYLVNSIKEIVQRLREYETSRKVPLNNQLIF